MKGTIAFLGREYKVKKPPQFAVREELVIAYGEAEGNTSRNLRVCAAVLGICSEIGLEAKADYVKARFDVLAYGGAVYGYLRQSGAQPAEVIAEATQLIMELTNEVFPREGEVAARAGFSSPAPAE
jgi:hypothetical protein